MFKVQHVSVHSYSSLKPSQHNLESPLSFLESGSLCLHIIFSFPNDDVHPSNGKPKNKLTRQDNQVSVSVDHVCVDVCVCNVTQQSDPRQVQLNSPSPYLHYNQIFVALQFHTQIIYSRWLQVNYFKCLTGTLNNWDVGIFSFPVLICQMAVCEVQEINLFFDDRCAGRYTGMMQLK